MKEPNSSHEAATASIAEELRRAEEARRHGQVGRARAAARRAAGRALEWWLEVNPRPDWPRAAFDRLQHVARDEAFPPQVREAARRLTLTVAPEPDAEGRVLPKAREAVRERVAQRREAERVPGDEEAMRQAQVIIDWVTRQMEP